jgi:hypothetical protein
MKPKIDPRHRALEVCLQGLHVGSDLEELLASYPKWADELRPLLRASQALNGLGVQHPLQVLAQEQSRGDFLQVAQRMIPRRSLPPWLAGVGRLFLLVFTLAALLFLLGWGALRLSARALPDSWLYPLRLAGEQVRLKMAKTPLQRLELEKTFDQQRLAEVQTLIQRGSRAEVDFSGGLSQMQAQEWLVGGVRVLVPPDARLVGVIQEGLFVHIQGELQPDGAVLARQVQTLEYQISGRVESITADRLVASGVELALLPETIFYGAPASGDAVQVIAQLTLAGRLQARLVEVLP